MNFKNLRFEDQILADKMRVKAKRNLPDLIIYNECIDDMSFPIFCTFIHNIEVPEFRYEDEFLQYIYDSLNDIKVTRSEIMKQYCTVFPFWLHQYQKTHKQWYDSYVYCYNLSAISFPKPSELEGNKKIEAVECERFYKLLESYYPTSQGYESIINPGVENATYVETFRSGGKYTPFLHNSI